MKIVTARELHAMPAGTIYHAWEPVFFGIMCIKGESFPPITTCDWWQVDVPSLGVLETSNLTLDAMLALDEGASVPVDLEQEGRDALYDDDRRFAVWERDDVAALRDKLDAILASTPPASGSTPVEHEDDGA